MLAQLTTDYLSNIISFLTLVEREYLAWTHSNLTRSLEPFHNSVRLSQRYHWVNSQFPDQVIQLFGGAKAMVTYPRLAWSHRYRMSTSYIDGILPEDMTGPIMVGVDCWGRPFVSYRIVGLHSTPVVETLFQRYCDDQNHWTHGCRGYGVVREHGHWMVSGQIKHKYLVDNISRLCHGTNYIVQERGGTDPVTGQYTYQPVTISCRLE